MTEEPKGPEKVSPEPTPEDLALRITAEPLKVGDYNNLIRIYHDKADPVDLTVEEATSLIRKLLVTISSMNDQGGQRTQNLQKMSTVIIQMLKHGVEVAPSVKPGYKVWNFSAPLLPRSKKGELHMKIEGKTFAVQWEEPPGGVLTRPTNVIRVLPESLPKVPEQLQGFIKDHQ